MSQPNANKDYKMFVVPLLFIILCGSIIGVLNITQPAPQHYVDVYLNHDGGAGVVMTPVYTKTNENDLKDISINIGIRGDCTGFTISNSDLITSEIKCNPIIFSTINEMEGVSLIIDDENVYVSLLNEDKAGHFTIQSIAGDKFYFKIGPIKL